MMEKEMNKKIFHKDHCNGCNMVYIDDLPGPTGLPVEFNVYLKKRLLWTYCSEDCLMEHFFEKKRTLREHEKSKSYEDFVCIWANKKRPSIKYRVLNVHKMKKHNKSKWNNLKYLFPLPNN